MTGKILCGLSLDEICNEILPLGFSSSHALKIAHGIYKKSCSSISGINGIPKKLCAELEKDHSSGVLVPAASETSSDGSMKYLFVSNGKKFESVYIPEGKRHTVCVSSQSGCRMGCPFCATGRYGFHGNLSADEMISQVIGLPFAEKITHVVFMGMGEPMDNLENVLKSLRILTAEWGKSLSPGNITVSTVGVTPGIRRFLDESDCNLAVSLFSPFFEERRKVVPVENKYPVEEIIGILRNATIRKKRRLTLSYVMIRNLNDSEEHLTEIRKLLSGSGIRINLLPYHPIDAGGYESSSGEKMQHFKHELVTSGISASIRKSRGSDISAACGLLASGISD